MKPSIITILLWLIAFANRSTVLAGGESTASQWVTGARQRQEDNIREAVFRYQFATNDVRKVQVFFLSVGQGKKGSDIFDSSHDPSDDFLKRFADLRVPMRKASASTFGRGSGWVVDKRTGKQGILLSVEAIRWVSESEVQVEGSLAAGMLAAGGYTYTVKKEKNAWKVTQEENTWIS